MDEEQRLEDVLDVLIDRFLDSVLHNLSRRSYPPDGSSLVAKQMEAISWLYYSYLHTPGQKHLDAVDFCKKATSLRPGLGTYTDGKNGKNNIVQVRVRAAAAAAAANAITDVGPDICITRAAVLLLSPDKKQCVIVKSLLTKSAWSFLEVDIRNNELAVENALLAVEEIIGINRDCIQVESNSHDFHCMSQTAGQSTRLYIMECKAHLSLRNSLDIEEAKWIPLAELRNITTGRLIKTSGYGFEPSPSIDYFHIFPYLDLLRQMCFRSSCSENDAISIKKRTQINEIAEATHSYDKIRSTKSTSSECNRNVNRTTKAQSGCDVNRGCTLAQKPSSKRSLEEQPKQEFKSDSIVLDSDDEEQNTVIKKLCSRKTIHNNSTVAAPSQPPTQERVTVDATQTQQVMDGVLKRTHADPDKERERSAQIARLQTKRQHLLQEVKQCQVETARQFERAQKNIEHAQLRATCLYNEIQHCELQMNDLLNESASGELKNGNRKNTIFASLRDPCQELEDFCSQNKWPKPNYLSEPVPFKSSQYLLTVRVELCGTDIQYSEKGTPKTELQEAKQSAAAAMLAKLYMLKAM